MFGTGSRIKHLAFRSRVFSLAGGSIDLEYRELEGIAIKLPNGSDMKKPPPTSVRSKAFCQPKRTEGCSFIPNITD